MPIQKSKKGKADNNLVILSILFFLFFVFVMGAVVLDRPIRSIVKAREAVVSPKSSFAIVWPLTIPADGKSSSKISVFLRNDKGEALSGKTAQVAASFGVVTPAQVQTDNIGKADFIIKSATPGKSQLNIKELSTGTTLTQQTSIEFTTP